jgi:methyl-accepting chemotaxis protein
MLIVAGIAIFAVIRLRQSALDTARIGDRLDSIALEIQVHNLEAQRRVRSYFLEVGTLGAVKAREQYLEEAEFEIHEIETLATRAIRIAPTADKREKFQHVSAAVAQYQQAIEVATKDTEAGVSDDRLKAETAAYENVADQLHDSAEDGELAGRDASETSQSEIEKISARTVPLVIGGSIAGFAIALTMCLALARTILVPIEHLRQVAESVSMGDLNVSVRRFSDDEMGDLSDSFSRMVTAVKFFRSEVEANNAGEGLEVGER